MHALVFGDGPAARLAVLILAQIDVGVTRALPGPRGVSSTADHVHSISPDVPVLAESIDFDLAVELEKATDLEWLWYRQNSAEWQEVRAPHLARTNVDAALGKRLEGLRWQSWPGVCGLRIQGANIVATDGQVHRAFNLVVDATGASRATLSMLECSSANFFLDEIGDQTRYRTARFLLPNPGSGATWKSVPADDPAGVLYGERNGRSLRLTGSTSPNRDGRVTCMGDIPLVFGASAATLVPKCAEFLDTTTTVAPPGRKLSAPKDLPGWIAFGDALIQSPPRLGLGITSIFQQGRCLLTGLRAGEDAVGLRNRLNVYADHLWMSVGLYL